MNREQRRLNERVQRRTQRRSAAQRGARLVIGGALIGAPVSVWGGSPVTAASFTVTNLNDSGAGSLRDAVNQANATPAADVITFQSGLSGTLTLSSGPIMVGLAPPANSGGGLTIQGPGPDVLTISGNNTSRIFQAFADGSSLQPFVVSGLTLTNGRADVGGAIRSFDRELTLDDVVLTNNEATDDGGALWADGLASVVTIRDSVFTGNTAADDGGAIYSEDTVSFPAPTPGVTIDNTVITGNSAGGDGGGVNLYDPSSQVLITESTISGNTAAGKGGGIYLYRVLALSEVMTIERSTISGNSATGKGGGMYLLRGNLALDGVTFTGNQAYSGGALATGTKSGSTSIVSSTISGNSALSAGGIEAGLPLTLDSTVVANNAVGDISGSVTANYSLIENTTGATVTGSNNVTGQDPGLGGLRDNGGPTRTLSPSADGPLIDAGNPTAASLPATDQRGVPRVVNGRADIGAVEYLGVAEADSYSGDEDVELVVAAPGVLANDSDAGSSPSVVTDVSNGTLVLAADGGFTYTPDAEYSGPDSFTYDLDGPLGSLGTALVSITVDAVDDTPVADDDTASAMESGAAVTIDVLANDDDIDSGSLTITAVDAGTLGSAVVDSSGASDVLVYTPSSGDGVDTFDYTVSDGTSSDTGTVTVTVDPDETDPTVDIVSPVDGAVFARLSRQVADFSCADEAGGSGLASCVGTVADGERLTTFRPGSYDFTVTATDDAGNTTTVTRSYEVVLARPDARVRVLPSGTQVGDDVYPLVVQGASANVRTGRSVTYEISVQNDAAFAEALRLAGEGSTKRFTLRYTTASGTDITDQVVAGTYLTPELAPGEAFIVRAQVTAVSSRRGVSRTRTLYAWSTTNQRRRDAVQFTTTIQ